MGLLGKAASRSAAFQGAAPQDIHALIADFYQKNPFFHCIALQGGRNFDDMISCHGAACVNLGDSTLILLPGGLDRELFAHRLSQSAGLAVLSQFSADSASSAIETLSPLLR